MAEEKLRTSESNKEKDIELQELQSQLNEREASLEKIHTSCKTAKETIEKQLTEKNELKVKINDALKRITATEHAVKEKEITIESLKVELSAKNNELIDKNTVEPTPENNASLHAVKLLYEEKDTECNKAKIELELEKKRSSELLVTIKVLRELNGMPTTPSPSPSPSPSLPTPPLPPPLQSSHTGNRCHSTQPLTASGHPNSGTSQTSRKRTSPTPPPLTVAPKAKRIIHVSETPTTTKFTVPTTTTTSSDCQSAAAANSITSISKTSSNQTIGHTNHISLQNNARSAPATSTVPIKHPSTPSAPVNASKETNANEAASSSKVSSTVTRPATSSTPGK